MLFKYAWCYLMGEKQKGRIKCMLFVWGDFIAQYLEYMYHDWKIHVLLSFSIVDLLSKGIQNVCRNIPEVNTYIEFSN